MRIQETQAELPRGSIPRSLEIILRAEAVETAQAGDRCDFTGALVVVPDVSQLRTPGNVQMAFESLIIPITDYPLCYVTSLFMTFCLWSSL